MNTASDDYPDSDFELLDLLTTAVLLLDADLRVERLNAAAQSLLSTSVSRVIGVPLTDLLPGADELVAAARRALLEGRSFIERDLDLRFGRPGAVAVDCAVSPLWHGGRDPVRLLLEVNHVERHQHIQSEGRMLLQNSASQALLQGLAHEIKNPLGGIRGAAQLLERELNEPALTEYTQVIIGEADRLRALVDRMLGPRGATRPEIINIHDVLEHVRLIVAAECGAIEIVRDYDPSLPPVLVDRDQMIQAMLNLLRNAVHALGTEGTVTLRTRIQRKFTIGTTLHRQVIRVDVADDGPGIDPELANSIFLPLVSGHADGSGLGLPIAQALVQRQNGLISFDSEPGATTFTVWLPLGEA